MKMLWGEKKQWPWCYCKHREQFMQTGKHWYDSCFHFLLETLFHINFQHLPQLQDLDYIYTNMQFIYIYIEEIRRTSLYVRAFALVYIYIWYDEPLPRAKASTCRAAIRVAEGVVRDIGEQVASSSSGLVPLSKCTVSHSERDFQVVAKRYQLHLPVQITSLNKTPGVRYTGDFAAISLRHW